MVEWLTTNSCTASACVIVVPQEEDGGLSESTIGAYKDFRSSIKERKPTKKILVDILWKRYLGKVTKKVLNQKSRDDLMTEAGLMGC